MSYINSIKVGDEIYPISLKNEQVGDGFKIDEQGILQLKIGTGLDIDGGKIIVKCSNGIEFDNSGITLKIGSGFLLDSAGINLKIGSGLEFDEDGTLYVKDYLK